MADQKESNKIVEREYVIPLRAKVKRAVRYKKTPKAIKTVKEFLVRHMKIRDRNLKKIKLDLYLNEFLWARGIKNPPHKVKVRAFMEGDNVRAELVDFPAKLKFKKIRSDRKVKEAEEKASKKKAVTKAKQDLEKKTVEDKKVESEKKVSIVETGKAMEKAEHKKAKHNTKIKVKEPKRPVRQSMQK